MISAADAAQAASSAASLRRPSQQPAVAGPRRELMQAWADYCGG